MVCPVYFTPRGVANMLYRKDLLDGGAHHFAETIRKIKQKYVGCDLPPQN